MTIEEIKDKLFEAFCIGSEWYNCSGDEVGKVEKIFRPKGIIVLRMSNGDSVSYDYNSMLDGRFIKLPHASWEEDEHPYHKYHTEQKRIDDEYRALFDGQQDGEK